MIIICFFVTIFMGSIILNYFLDKFYIFKEGFKEGLMGSSSQNSLTTDTTEVSDTSDSTKEEPEPPKAENEPDPNPKNDTSEDTTEDATKDDETIKTNREEQVDTITNKQNETIKDEIYNLIEEFKTLRKENLDKLSDLPYKFGQQTKKYKRLKKKVESDNKASKTNENMETHYSVIRMKKPISSDLQLQPPQGVDCWKYFNGENVNVVLDNESVKRPVKKKSLKNIDTTVGLNKEQIKEKNKLIIENDFKPEIDYWNDNLKNKYENKDNNFNNSTVFLTISTLLSNVIHRKIRS